jgi:hypothetical protein
MVQKGLSRWERSFLLEFCNLIEESDFGLEVQGSTGKNATPKNSTTGRKQVSMSCYPNFFSCCSDSCGLDIGQTTPHPKENNLEERQNHLPIVVEQVVLNFTSRFPERSAGFMVKVLLILERSYERSREVWRPCVIV